MALYDKKLDWYDFFLPGSADVGLWGGGLKQVGNIANDLSGTTSVNEFNANEAQKQRDWEEYMSNTAYQRAINDMNTAGISPAMLYQSGGQGATTPSGANATGRLGNAMSMIGQTANLVNSITNARKVDAFTKSNEIKANDATRIYQAAAKMASLMAKTMV